MMYSIEQVQTGLSKYLDENLIPQLSCKNKVLVGAGIAIAIRKLPNILKNNDMISMLGIVTDDGVDVELFADELIPRIGDDKLCFCIPGVEIKLDRSDVEMILKYIKEN